jgi:uncharacterized protein (TIGR02145 family)
MGTGVGAAGTITGSATVCKGQTGVSYSVGAITNATSYTWSYTGTGLIYTAGYNSNSMVVTISASATSGNLTVYGVNACGNGAASATFAITVKPVVMASVTISANPSGAVCSGTSVIFTTTPTNGGATPAYQWKKGGVTIGGATNSTYAYTPANNDAITCVLTNNESCVFGSPATSSAITMTVNAPPTTANAGADINPTCGVSTATLAGNTPTVGTGTWSVVSGAATITTPTSPTSGVTGLAVPGTATLRWTISNSPCAASTDDVVITTCAAFTCGSTFTDPRDSKVYNTVTIGTQCWFKQNLNYHQTAYGNDWCYLNSSSNCTTYGRLYDWAAAMQGATSSNLNPSGVQGVCPTGWHLPSDAEWDVLMNYLGGFYVAGGKMKETGTAYWTYDPGVTNSSGFTAFGGGTFDALGYNWYEITEGAYFWSSTQSSSPTTSASYRYINYNRFELDRYDNPKYYGMSVRCVHN